MHLDISRCGAARLRDDALAQPSFNRRLAKPNLANSGIDAPYSGTDTPAQKAPAPKIKSVPVRQRGKVREISCLDEDNLASQSLLPD
jgi:hypothetical protein